MRSRVHFRRAAGTLALVGGLGLAAIPAGAAPAPAPVPTATLQGRTVVVTGTGLRDVVAVTTGAAEATVDFGLDGTVDARFPRSAFDRVDVRVLGGDDGVSLRGAGEVPAAISGGDGADGLGVVGSIGETGDGDAATTLDGDAGDDRLFAATPGPVTVRGGAGNDVVDGGGAGVGQETVDLGAGDDRFRSSLNSFIGRRTDTVDGGPGRDVLDVQGSFASESVGLTAQKGRLVVDHDFGDRITADAVEDVSWLGFGSVDSSGSGDAVAVDDLSSTDVVRFTPDFSAGAGADSPNGSADTLTVRATDGVDRIVVSGAKANVTVAGLTPTVTPVFLQPDDFLRIETLAGDDVVDTSGLQPGLVQVLIL